MGHSKGWVLTVLSKLAILVVAIVACSSPGSQDQPTSGPSGQTSSGQTSSGQTDSDPANPGSSSGTAPTGCEPATGTAWSSEAVNRATRVFERADGLTVDLVEYPLPDYDGKPWSQWGQGVVAGDGRFISAVGDHHGVDGNSFFFSYDPEKGDLTRFSDVLSHSPHQPGEFGYGKVHAQMVVGACGEVYAHTYWGSRRGLEYTGNYRGDLLFRIDPWAEVVEMMGVPVEHRGTASMAGSPDGRLLFLEAVEPVSNLTDFVVYDVVSRQVVDTVTDPNHTGRRSMAVTPEGRVYFSVGEGELAAYDPATGEVTDTGSSIPGRMLRAATAPGPSGTIIAVSSNPDEFFSIDAAGEIERLGAAAGYTASLAMSPDGEDVYFLPEAHGKSWQLGTPILNLDPTSGEQTTVVELVDIIEEAAGVRAGGTYNVVVDDAGENLYVGINAGEGEETFGRVFLVVIGLP